MSASSSAFWIASLSDLDATWGFKRKDEPFLGHEAHVVCDETGIVTAATLTPGHESEQGQVSALFDEVQERNPGTLYLAADKGYDTGGAVGGNSCRRDPALHPAQG